MSRPMNLNDAGFLLIEKQQSPMHVAALSIFARPPHSPTFLRNLVARWRECKSLAAPINWRIKWTPTPGWETLESSEIDLDYHFRHSALPEPGVNANSACWSPVCIHIRSTGVVHSGSAI